MGNVATLSTSPGIPFTVFGPYCLSNGQLVQITTDNNSVVDFWMSTDNGVSYSKTCWIHFSVLGNGSYFDPYNFAFKDTKVVIFNKYGDGLLKLYAIDLSGKFGQISAVDWSVTVGPGGYTNAAYNVFWGTDGTIYTAMGSFDSEGFGAYFVHRTPYGGTPTQLYTNNNYAVGTSILELSGKAYFLSPDNSTIYSYEPIGGWATLATSIPIITLNGANQILAHPDGSLYLAVGNSTANYIIVIYKWNGSSFTSTGSFSSTLPATQFQMGSDGNIYAFCSITNGNVGYYVISNNGSTISAYNHLNSIYMIGRGRRNDQPNIPATRNIVGIGWKSTSAGGNVDVWTQKLNSAPNTPTQNSYSGGNGVYFNGSNTLTFNWGVSDPDGNNLVQYRFIGSYDGFATWHYDSGIQPCNVASGGILMTSVAASALAEHTGWQFLLQVADTSGAWSDWGGWGTYFIVDKTPPTATPDNGGTYDNVSGGTHRVWLRSVTDNLSGVTGEWYYLPPGGSWSAAIGYGVSGSDWYCDVPKTVEGQYFANMYLRDNSQNSAASYPFQVFFIYDKTPPAIASVQGYSYTNVKTGTRRVWAYGVADSLSGVANVTATYLKPGGTRTAITAYQSGSDWYVDVPLDGATESEWNVQFQAKDRAGNSSGIATAYFFVDTQRAGDPNPGAVWGQTQATLTWSGFADPSPSSGYDHTVITLGEWDGISWVGGAPSIYNELSIPDSSVSQKVATGLIPGKRYRYTVAYYDKAGNQSAYTWHEFVTKRKIGEQRVKTSSGTASLPIYDPLSGVVGSTALRAKTASGSGCFELVATNDTNASPLRVKTTQGIMAVSKFGGT